MCIDPQDDRRVVEDEVEMEDSDFEEEEAEEDFDIEFEESEPDSVEVIDIDDRLVTLPLEHLEAVNPELFEINSDSDGDSDSDSDMELNIPTYQYTMPRVSMNETLQPSPGVDVVARTSPLFSLHIQIQKQLQPTRTQNLFLQLHKVFVCGELMHVSSALDMEIDIYDLKEIGDKLEEIMRGGVTTTWAIHLCFRRKNDLLIIRKAYFGVALSEKLIIHSTDARFLLITLREMYDMFCREPEQLHCNPDERNDSNGCISWL